MKKPLLQSQLPKNLSETLCGAHPPPTLRQWCMGGGFDHTGRTVIIAATVRNAAGRQCTETINGIKMASTLSAPTAARELTEVVKMCDLTYMDCWNYVAPLILAKNGTLDMDIYVMVFHALKEADERMKENA